MMKKKMLAVALVAASCLLTACTFGKNNKTPELSSAELAQIRADIESEIRAEEAAKKAEEERIASEKASEEAKKAKEEKASEEARKKAEQEASEKASEEAEKKKISLEEEEKKKAEEEAKAKAKKEAEAKAKKEAEEKAKAEEEAAAKAAEDLNKARAEAMAHPSSSAIDIANAARAEAGLSALSYDGVLSSLASVRAAEAAQSFSHTRPDGRSCFTILDENAVAYMTCGENIAAGQTTEEEVMNAWLNSPGHRANILNGAFHKVGLGFYDAGDAYGRYWVTIFTD